MPRRSVLSTVDYENLLAVPTSKEEMLRYYTPSGRALAGMLAVFAQFEREILSDRVKAGIAQARAEGRPHGRPPTAQNKEAEVWSLSEAGLKPGKIAKELGISRTSVRRKGGRTGLLRQLSRFGSVDRTDVGGIAFANYRDLWRCFRSLSGLAFGRQMGSTAEGVNTKPQVDAIQAILLSCSSMVAIDISNVNEKLEP